MDKKTFAKKVATAAIIGAIAATSLTACETILKAGDAASGKSKGSCKGQSSCKGGSSCKGQGSN